MNDDFSALKEAFERDSMTLEEAALILCGYPPERLLRFASDKLKDPIVFTLFNRARHALRGKVLEGTLEGTTWYVRLYTLGYWAFRKKIPMHPSIDSFLDKEVGSKKAGRPRDCPEIVSAIAEHYRSTGLRGITAAVLVNDSSPFIQASLRDFIAAGSGAEIKRRTKTLATNVTRLLATALPSACVTSS